jgi:hypothetical protein
MFNRQLFAHVILCTEYKRIWLAAREKRPNRLLREQQTVRSLGLGTGLY